MFEPESVPYFPFPCNQKGEYWTIKNPLSDAEHTINASAWWLLQHCNGSLAWDEIVFELASTYHLPESSVISHAKPFLSTLTREGILWWRTQKIDWKPVSPPDFILWNLTNRCNLRCRHCAVASGSAKKNELTTGECQKFIDQISAFGVRYLILSGGEPLMRKDLFTIADYASDAGISFQLATNGTMITEDIASRLATLQACAHVSLDALTPQIHDRFRQSPGSWERTTRGIRHLADAGVPVIVAAVVTRMNIHEIPDLYRFSSSLGDVSFRIMPFIPYGRGKGQRDLEVTPEEMRDLTSTLLEMKKTGMNDLVSMEFECTFSPPWPGVVEPRAHIGCSGAVTYCEVMAGGQVLPCSFFEGVKMENIREIPFPWIWENSRFLNYFRSLNIQDIGGFCRKCDWLPSCRGSCIASNFVHGDIFQSNCHCWLVSSGAKRTRP